MQQLRWSILEIISRLGKYGVPVQSTSCQQAVATALFLLEKTGSYGGVKTSNGNPLVMSGDLFWVKIIVK